jgi:hypothetical protein
MLAADLLTAWDQGRSRTPAGRGQSLLAALRPEAGRRTALSVGQRDALLFDLRGELFGSGVEAVASCPGCAEQVELTFELDDVRARPPGDPTADLELVHDGYTVRARPPTTADLAALEGVGSAAEGRELLLGRCVVAALRGGTDVSPAELPESVRVELATRMAEADPQADTRLVLTCPGCGRTWDATFDIVSFLWQELDTEARRLVREVHGLASAYGWPEAEILAMSPARRSLYLEMIRR